MSKGQLVTLCALTSFLTACAEGTLGFESVSTTMTTAATMTTEDPTATTSTTSTSGSTTAGTETDTDTDGTTDTDTDTGTDTGEIPPDLDAPKARIYQLTVRLFSNTNTTNQKNGDRTTNGVGKFEEIDDTALAELRSMGFSHIWLHGALQQATNTDNGMGEPADDPDAVKGLAGNYYAIRDYYDVCPDYASSPDKRMAEFEALVDRIHANGMKVVLDFVPNHIARVYRTNVQGKTDFGLGEPKTAFFTPTTSLFYLVEPPDQVLTLPTPDWWTPPGTPDGTLDSENGDDSPVGDVPRATGNNVNTPTPAITDWYDTLKLSYGYNFIDMTGEGSSDHPTWKKMDDILKHWQQKGVDGFRVDSAHYIPMSYWTWQIEQARNRDPDALFIAEAIEGPEAVPGFSFAELLTSGFDAVYDTKAYDIVKRVLCCSGNANDLTTHLSNTEAIRDQLVRYAEHHDERRIASPKVTGLNPTASGFGSAVAGRPAATLLYLLTRGPVVVYNGQEVGEPGAGDEGYGRDDGRTTLFDYWSMPELRKWVNGNNYDGGDLSQNQTALRAYYRSLLEIATLPAIAEGELLSLQEANKAGSTYCSLGRWCYTFLRYTEDGSHVLMVLANLNPENTYKAFVIVPQQALDTVGLDGATTITMRDRLDPDTIITADVAKLTSSGVQIELKPSQARVLELKAAP
jgi:glycosidase